MDTFAHDIEVANSDGVTIYYTWKNNNTELFVSYRGISYSTYSNEYTGNVVIPSTVTYNGNTFPVTSIGWDAFYQCTGLTSVTIPNSVTSIGGSAFYGCSGLTSITIPNSVTNIGRNAFSDCSGLTSITIPNSVTSIGGSAFSGCSGLTSVTIPESVTNLEGTAFPGCSGLTSIIVEDENPVYDSRNNCNAIIESNTNTLISGCKNTVIPSSVTSIGYKSFYNCIGLTSVTIPESVTSIGFSAFEGCSELTSITFPESVTSIGNNAFSGTAWYNNQADGVVYVCKIAYKYKGTMPSAADIRIKDGTIAICASAFSGCSNLYSIVIPNSVTSIGDYAFRSCRYLQTVKIPNSVTSIGASAFEGCSYFYSITIPASVTSIGLDAFSDCGERINSIVVEDGNTVYDSRDNCNAIIETATNTLICGCKNTSIPSSVTSIGFHAFSGCTGLTSFTVPKNVTSIGGGAFYGCTFLWSVSIPSSVTSIGSGPFYQTTRLRSVKIDIKTPIPADNYVFNYNSSSVTLFVPKGSKRAYQNATWWNRCGKIIEFPDADVNQDGKVNVVDVVDIARFVVGTTSSTYIEFLADLNSDDDVNVADAVVLVNEIAGDQNFSKAFGAPQAAQDDYLTLTENDDHSLSLSMESQRDFTAFQLELSTNSDADVMAMVLNAARKNGHQMMYNKVGDGRYRVVVLSVANNAFNGDNGELLNIQLDGFNTGDVTISNIHFITTDGTDHRFDDLSVQGGTTGLNNLTPDTQQQTIYDLQGRKRTELQRGVNIVNGKKVIVK